MGSSTLTVDDVGILNHDRRIEVGSSQSMVFLETDLPPIFSPTAEKYDTIVAGESITKQLTKAQLKKTLEDKGLTVMVMLKHCNCERRKQTNCI